MFENKGDSQVKTSLAASSGNLDDDQYRFALSLLDATFIDNLPGPLFTTDVEGLWEAYLSHWPEGALRQHHNCSACRYFVNRYLGLVSIRPDGRTDPIFFNDSLLKVFPAFKALRRLVASAKVTGVFLTSKQTLGLPLTGPWRHMAVNVPAQHRHVSLVQTAGQKMAERREDFKNVSRALAEFPLDLLNKAFALLECEQLYRSEKVLGPVRFLRSLSEALEKTTVIRKNVIWRAIATAPAGFCHPRASMAGTLLEDLRAGIDYSLAAKRFADKMHPLAYQRPQAPPKAGTIEQAEKLVEQLGIAQSLKRRFARMEDIKFFWQSAPKETSQASTGVFGHLRERSPQPEVFGPPITMTWAKFSAEVLPKAEQIHLYVPSVGNFCALVTAVDLEAPPIIQWDTVEQRNPVSWYIWCGGSSASQFRLVGGAWTPVPGICLSPHMWFGSYPNHKKSAIFVLEGARESKGQAGAAIFPEILKSELHGIRSVIEAYSKRATLEGLDEPMAAGLMAGAGSNWGYRLRVRSGSSLVEYILDRWD